MWVPLFGKVESSIECGYLFLESCPTPYNILSNINKTKTGLQLNNQFCAINDVKGGKHNFVSIYKLKNRGDADA